MPEVGGVLESALFVDDPGRSGQFYRTLFGFEAVSVSERGCVLRVGGPQILLLCKKGAFTRGTVTSGGVVPPCDASGTSHLAFSIAASDLEAWEKWLAQNSIPIESKVTWERGGQSLYFRDPDQHLIELATPGVWPIY